MRTILNDPIGLANRAVGTKKKYRFMQIMTILLGISVSALLFLMDRFNRPLGYLPLHVLLFALIIAFPLMYLKAIRALIKLREKEEKKMDGDKRDRDTQPFTARDRRETASPPREFSR